MFCTLDDWHGKTMEEKRKLEDETRLRLDEVAWCNIIDVALIYNLMFDKLSLAMCVTFVINPVISLFNSPFIKPLSFQTPALKNSNVEDRLQEFPQHLKK